MSIKSKLKREPQPAVGKLLSTGSTLVNLAMSGKTSGGLQKGKFYYVVGDSTSGKTFLSLTCFAEAMRTPEYADYRLIFDNVEDGALLDFSEYFGKKVADRVEPPRGTREAPVYSDTVQSFYYHCHDAIQAGSPFIYVLDSMDALIDGDESEKFEKNKDLVQAGKEAKGTYGMGKAKANSTLLPKILKGLRDTGSILIIISQTRENVGFGFAEKTRAGGKSLKFYACTEFWSSVVETLKKSVKGKERQIGIKTRIKFSKNRITGKLRTVDVCLYHASGFDDVGSNIDWLVAEGHWKKASGINATEFGVKLDRESLVAHIEEGNLEVRLRKVVGGVWREIEEASKLIRKKRYE